MLAQLTNVWYANYFYIECSSVNKYFFIVPKKSEKYAALPKSKISIILNILYNLEIGYVYLLS